MPKTCTQPSSTNLSPRSKAIKGNGHIEITYLPIKKLRHPQYNEEIRILPDEERARLRDSLAKFNAIDPAVVNMQTGREYIIIGGNQRVKVAREDLGWTEYPCVCVKLPLKREKELNVRLNQPAGYFNSKGLLGTYDVNTLLDFGFNKEELTIFSKNAGIELDINLKTSTATTSGEDEGVDAAAKDGKVDEVEATELDPVVYCAVRNFMDVGRGWCGHNCMCCFTKITPAGRTQKKDNFRFSTKNSINQHIRRAQRDSRHRHV